MREFDQRGGLTDLRIEPDHLLRSMVRQRIYSTLAGCENQNDHETLRYDPVFQLICDRIPNDNAWTASQPTRSKFSNAFDIRSLFRPRELFVE